MKRSFHTKVDAWLIVVIALPVLFIGYELIIDFSWFLLLPFAFIIAIYAVTASLLLHHREPTSEDKGRNYHQKGH